VGFVTVQVSTVHPLIHYCGWTMQIFIFFQFGSQFFFGDLVLIKDQLILISYENVRLKEEGPE